MPCQCGCSTEAPRQDVDVSTGCECGCSSPAPPVGEQRDLETVVAELERRIQKLEAAR